MLVLGWVVLIVGLAIVGYELVAGGGLSLVGIGIAAVGAAVAFGGRGQQAEE